jgi:hypothetical protein
MLSPEGCDFEKWARSGNRSLDEHGKSDAVVDSTEVCDLPLAFRLLASEVVGWDTQHHQATLPIFAEENLLALVLGREAALPRGIHQKQHFALVLAQRAFGATQQRREAIVQQHRTS